MLDRGTAAFTLATAAIALMALALAQTLLFYAQYWGLLIGPGVALVLCAGVWLALRRVCTGSGGAAHAAALGGILLLCAWSVLGMSFGALVAIPAALMLMVAHAVVPPGR